MSVEIEYNELSKPLLLIIFEKAGLKYTFQAGDTTQICIIMSSSMCCIATGYFSNEISSRLFPLTI